MRTLEYLAVTLFMSALVWYGATYVAETISTSLNASAALIDNPASAR